MEQQILQTDNPKERIQILKDTCVKTETFTYPKQLSNEELELEKHNFTQHAITVEIADKKLQEAKEIHKSETKPVKEEMKTQISKIRSGIEEVTETVFLLDEQDEGKMGYYNSQGVLVYERLLMQDERQLRIIGNNSQTGTSD
ncbi:hypothetical protein [Tenacibaculum sp. C7A-26P2]|uniref:hypothetical protein n=1 Tax=Tenacibaculum sp. C7A-26P2 TaxID=3447504 RepID=UPI003F85DF3D